MSRQSKGAYLYLEPARTRRGKVEPARWAIRDRGHKQRLPFLEGELEQAQQALAGYVLGKHDARVERNRDPASVPVADVLQIYAEDVVNVVKEIDNDARQREAVRRIERLNDGFRVKTVAEVNKATVAAYIKTRGKVAAARRELEDLRAAINHAHEAGFLSSVVKFKLPEKSSPRDRWLTRQEAARLLKAAWRMRQRWNGNATERSTGHHLVRFILVALYTGTRSGAICKASLVPAIGRGRIDLQHGVFTRRPPGVKINRKNKNANPVRLPPRLLAHLRRWHRMGLMKTAVVEWNGRSVKRVKKSFATACRLAGLEGVTPHTLRHTSTTWLLQRGVIKEQVAGYVGMSRDVLERVYGHHSPDHQEEAVNALSRPRKVAGRR
jgi:integrase